jgi:hypothetical protein
MRCESYEEGGVVVQRVFVCSKARYTEPGGKRRERVVMPVGICGRERGRCDYGAEMVEA